MEMVDIIDLKSIEHCVRMGSNPVIATNIKTYIIMNENINLCEILKGHEGEAFYSPCYGYIILKAIKPSCYFSLFFYDNNSKYKFTKHGKISANNNADCVLFPSKEQQDWNKWIEENKPKHKPKIPKTLSDTLFNSSFIVYELSYIDNDKDYVLTSTGISPIERSALALLKIHQLIEVGYGGNISSEEWNNNKWKFTYQYTKTGIDIISTRISKYIIAFHTKEQAEEFLSYPENIQLLKDYFMIDE